MSAWIERIVDGQAKGRAKSDVILDHTGSASVGEDGVVLRNERSERVVRCVMNPFQGCGCIHIPKCDEPLIGFQAQHFGLEEFIKNSYSTRLDHQIGMSGVFELLQSGLPGIWVYDHPRPVRRLQI